MFTKVAETVYRAYLAELRKTGRSQSRRKKRLYKLRRFLLKLGDPDITVPLAEFDFQTPFSSNIILYHFESPLYDAVLPRLAQAVQGARGGMILVDVGANVGAATYLVSREISGRFFCIEANPRFQASLRHNLGQIPQSSARFTALSDEKRRMPVRHHYTEGNSNIEAASEGSEWLDFVTLDEALAEAPDFNAPTLLKIDTEGFELKILRGATRTLTENRPPLFFEFYPALIRKEGGEPDALFELLRGHGYDQFIFYDGGGNLFAAVNGRENGQLQSLRRYAELRKSFFDVAAFHAEDAGLCRDFLTAESCFFERQIGL
jgi:FkbM family methyltransferase